MYIKRLILLFVVFFLFVNISFASTKVDILDDWCYDTIDTYNYKTIEPTLTKKVVALWLKLHLLYLDYPLNKQYVKISNIVLIIRWFYQKFNVWVEADERKRNIVKVLDDYLTCKLDKLKEKIDDWEKLVNDTYEYVEDSDADIQKSNQNAWEIIVTRDKDKPVITILWDNPAEVEFWEPYTDSWAIAHDIRDWYVLYESWWTVDVNTVWTYEITYTASDLAWNTVTAKRTVEVIDTTPPEIQLTWNDIIVVWLWNVFNDPWVNVSDKWDPNVSYQTSWFVDTSKVWSYTLTYTSRDASWNVAEPQIRTVVVKCTASWQIWYNSTKYSWCSKNDVLVCTWDNVWYILSSCNLWTNSSSWYGHYYERTWTSSVWTYIDRTVWSWNEVSNPCSAWYHIPSAAEWQWLLNAWGWWQNGTKLWIDLNLPLAWYFDRSLWEEHFWQWDYWEYMSSDYYLFQYESNRIKIFERINDAEDAYTIVCFKN